VVGNPTISLGTVSSGGAPGPTISVGTAFSAAITAWWVSVNAVSGNPAHSDRGSLNRASRSAPSAADGHGVGEPQVLIRTKDHDQAVAVVNRGWYYRDGTYYNGLFIVESAGDSSPSVVWIVMGHPTDAA